MSVKIPFEFKKFSSLDREHLKVTIIGAASIIGLMVLAGFITFFLSLRGAELTMVPNLADLELATALIELQEKELYPRIQLRFSQDTSDKGRIIGQNPVPGSIVKAGRRINLIVSRGVVVDKVENFIGQDLNEVKIHLQTLFTAQNKPLITIKEPPVYVFDKAVAGTILEQKPIADTEITGQMSVEFVVSRGPAKPQVKVPDLMGLALKDSLLRLEKANAAFTFTARKADGREIPGTVVAQLPTAGSLIPQTTKINLVISEPNKSEDLVFGVLQQILPEYPYPLKLSLEVVTPSGERLPLLSIDHPGGEFSVPYQVPAGSLLVLSILNKEIFRMEVTQ